MNEEVDVTVTDRGFKHTTPVPSEYGGQIHVYESSAASAPHIWLSLDYPANLNEPNGEMLEGVAHLTLDSVDELIDRLQYLRDNHYQVK